MTEGLIGSGIVQSGSTVTKPICPATDVTGSFSVVPRIYAAPASVSSPTGVPLVSMQVVADDISATEWLVTVLFSIDEDDCTSDLNNPVSGACTTPDGLADVYAGGYAWVGTRCY